MIELLAAAVLLMVSPFGHPIDAFANHASGAEVHALRIAEMLHDAATTHHVDPVLLTALAFHESTFDVNAVSARGAFGLLQVHPRWWGAEARWQCRQAPAGCSWWSTLAGARALAHYKNRCRSDAAAIGAYRTGRCGVGPEARKVMRTRNWLRARIAKAGV